MHEVFPYIDELERRYNEEKAAIRRELGK